MTITLDRLLAGGRPISEVVVIHTEDPAVRQALDMVAGEFAGPCYQDISFRPVPVASGRGKIQDFCNDADLRALLRTLYNEVRRARQ